MNWKVLAGAIVVLAAIVLVPQTLFIINEYDQAVVVQFGEPMRTVQQPGLHFKKPFIQQIMRFDKRVLTADGSPHEYITADRKRIIVDHIARWRIANPERFYATVINETGALQRISDLIGSMLRQEVANHDFKELINVQRETIMETVTDASRVGAREFGIEIVDVRIKRADLPTQVEQSVFDRMQAERQAVAAGYRAEGDERALEIRSAADKERDVILAKAYEESQRIRGEGEAKAMQIYADAYNQDPEFFNFIRSLDVYESILDKDSTLILSTDSALFQYLESPN